ncbi:MAG: BMP family protein [Gemmatimonadota bacterium]
MRKSFRNNVLGIIFRSRNVRNIVILHSALLSVACGGKSADSATDSAFRVALLTPGPISDQAWNGAAYTGLERIRDSLGASISHIQTKTPAEFDENFRQYGAQGYDLVIGHGFEFQEAARRVAPLYRKTRYATTGGEGLDSTVVALAFAFNEPAYLAGMAAAAVSKTGIIGVIGGTELPPVKAGFTGFTAGARAVRPDIQVLTSYVGNWEDASAAKEQALAQIARKVDVIWHNADAAGLGIFQAVRQSKGVWIIGANADQNGVAPKVTLGSVVIDLPHAFLLLARRVQGGESIEPTIQFHTASDVVRWVPNPSLTIIPAATAARIDSVRASITAGTFSVDSASR